MKLEKKEFLKLQHVNNVQTKASHINSIQDSGNELAEKVTQTLKVYEKNQKFKSLPSFKNWFNCCRRCRQKPEDKVNKRQKHREPS